MNPMMAMMMMNSMKMMMAHNLNQMTSRAQNMQFFHQKPIVAARLEPQFVDLEESEPQLPITNSQTIGIPFHMDQNAHPMMQNPANLSPGNMQQRLQMMGCTPSHQTSMSPFSPKDAVQTSPLQCKSSSKPRDSLSASKPFSPAIKELICVDSPNENTSTSTCQSTMLIDPKTTEKIQPVPQYSDFKPFSAEEVFEVQTHSFNKLP
jgi:hypothetical protein